jgi:hypothetical protein
MSQFACPHPAPSRALPYPFFQASGKKKPQFACPHPGPHPVPPAKKSHSLPVPIPPIPILSFWHTQPKWSTPDRLSVYYKTSADGAWTLIPGASFTAEVPVWTQRVFDLPEASATYSIAFEARSDTGYGVCIDDVEVYPALTAQGTPQAWLTQHNLTDGGLTFDEAEALDSDGDAFFNWQEFIAGTDPTNSASAFRILGLDPGPPATVIFEPSTPDRDYTLQATTNLVVGPWADVPGQGPRMGGEGEDAMEDDGAATPTRFYRVKVQVP